MNKKLTKALSNLNKLASHYNGIESTSNRIKQFVATKKKTKNSISNITTKNRYELAYYKVFNDYPKWKQNEINELKANNDLNNRHYSEFIQQVIELAESSTPIFLTT